MSVKKWQWLVSPSFTGLMRSKFSSNPDSWEKEKKERTSWLEIPNPIPSTRGCLLYPCINPLPASWRAYIFCQDESRQDIMWAFNAMAQPQTLLITLENFLHTHNGNNWSKNLQGLLGPKSLLTLLVFNYPLIARHKPPCIGGKDRAFQ